MYTYTTETGVELRRKMGKKKRSVEDDWPDPTPDRQLERSSGWCSTGYHDGCKYQFTFGKCGCDCHKEKK